MKNVADDEQYKQVIQRLRDRLMRELQRTGDPRVVDGGKYFEKLAIGRASEQLGEESNARRRTQR